MKFTDTSIRALLPPEKGQKLYADESLPGFAIRVSQGGAKTFVLQTRGEFITLGRFPIISLAEARGEAKRILAERTLGKLRPQSVAFDDAKDEFLRECEKKNRPATVRGYESILRRQFPFGRKKLREITYHDIQKRLDKIKRPSELSHAITCAKIFLRWAQKPPRRYIELNPTEGLSAPKQLSRKRVLTDNELVKVWRRAGACGPFGQVTKLLILWGSRIGEVVKLRRPWIDERERLINFPAEVMKGKIAHTIPYGDMSAAVLEIVPRLNTTDLLFPATKFAAKGVKPMNSMSWHKEKFDDGLDVEPYA